MSKALLSIIIVGLVITSTTITTFAREIPSKNLSTGKYAVIVGISDYPGDSNDLNYCDDDARSIRDILEDNGWEIVDILIDTSATKSNVIGAINRMRGEEDKNSISLFYFSGHGTQLLDQDNDEVDVWDEAICLWDGYLQDDELVKKIKGFDGKIIVILDSCYSGGFGEANKDWANASIVWGEGFIEDFGVNENCVMLLSCAENEASYEYDSLKHGVFTYYVIKGLEGSADNDGDDCITAEEVFYYAGPKTENLTGGRQHPCIYDQNPYEEIPIIGGESPPVDSAKLVIKVREIKALDRMDFPGPWSEADFSYKIIVKGYFDGEEKTISETPWIDGPKDTDDWEVNKAHYLDVLYNGRAPDGYGIPVLVEVHVKDRDLDKDDPVDITGKESNYTLRLKYRIGLSGYYPYVDDNNHYLPGDDGWIHASGEDDNLDGEKDAEIVLKIEDNIVVRVKLDPEILDFGTVKKGEEPKMYFTVTMIDATLLNDEYPKVYVNIPQIFPHIPIIVDKVGNFTLKPDKPILKVRCALKSYYLERGKSYEWRIEIKWGRIAYRPTQSGTFNLKIKVKISKSLDIDQKDLWRDYPPLSYIPILIKQVKFLYPIIFRLLKITQIPHSKISLYSS